MTATDTRTARQTILEAAGSLGPEFSESELVVACWKLDPVTFGLAGFRDQFPDSRNLRWRLMGVRGLVNDGHLRRIGSDRYALTPGGRAPGTARKPVRVRDVPRVGLSKVDAERFRALLMTRAYRRHHEGMSGEITYADAETFWLAGGGSPSMVADLIERAGTVAASGAVALPGGMEIGEATVRAVGQTAAYLVATFLRRLERNQRSVA